MSARTPCKTCPWRVDATAAEIPNFSLDLAEGLVRCNSGELGAPVFACHQSREGNEVVCAGWLATHGENSIAVRLGVIHGEMPVEALTPGEGWPELHPSFEDMIEKLRRTDAP